MRPVFVTLAFQGVTFATKVFTWELCSTRMGTSSVKRVKTETKTDTVHVTEIQSYCPNKHKTVYVTPTVYTTDTYTSTITAFVTASQKTDITTVTMTGTVTNLDSTTETDTYTVSSTTTVTQTPTTTSSTPAGFTPISKESGYVARKRYISKEERHTEINRRGVKMKGQSGKSIRVKVGGKEPQCSPYLYPQNVECLEIITTVIKQRRKLPYCCDGTKTRIARPKTCTRHKTRKATITSTITPADATVTAQASTTITTVSTTTTTVSTAVTSTVTKGSNSNCLDTETAIAPTYTAYAACGSDNIVTTANGGQGINLFNYDTANALGFSSSITSPRDCCAFCQQTTNCIFSAFFPPPDQRRCAFVTSGSCIPSSAQGTYFQTSSQQSLAGAIALSNGPCGQVANMGSDA